MTLAPWALLGLMMLILLWRLQSLSAEFVLGAFGASLLWLALYRWTGDRRFFFPYAMQFAVQAALLLTGRVSRPVVLGGGGFTLLFAVIRILQGATAFVLFVELLVACVILGLTGYAKRRVPLQVTTRAVAGTVGSLLAFAGLLVN